MIVVKKLGCGRPTCACIGIATENDRRIATYAPAHCRSRECNYRHSIAIVWQCEQVALQKWQRFTQLFNYQFPLPQQVSWSVYQPSKEICMRVLSVLQMQATSMDVWRRLPKAGKYTGVIERPMPHL